MSDAEFDYGMLLSAIAILLSLPVIWIAGVKFFRTLADRRTRVRGKVLYAVWDALGGQPLTGGIAEAHHDRGLALSNLGRHDEALEAFDEAIRIDPDYADARQNRNKTLRALGRDEDPDP